MDFEISGMVVFSVAGIFLSWAVGHFWSKYGEYESTTTRLRAFWKSFIVTQAILMLVGNVLTVGISWLTTRVDTRNEDVDMSICDITKQLGLESGRPYDVEVGARDGEVYSVGLDSVEEGLVLGLPMKSASFFKDAVKPTITINLSCKKTVSATQVVHFASPHWLVESGFLMLTQEVTGREAPVPDKKSLVTKGIKPFVSKYLTSVEVHLTPDLYNKILG